MSEGHHTELDDDALAMLDAFRAQEQLPDDVHERVWDRVAADVANERRAVWLRRGAALGVLAAAAVALLWVGGRMLPTSVEREPASQAGYERSDERQPGVAETRTPDAERMPAEGAEAPAPLEAIAPPSTEPAPAPEAEDGTAPATEDHEAATSTPKPRRSDSARKAPRPGSTEEPPAPRPGDDLAEENRILGQARRALIDERPERALARLADHERRFPTGVLTEERKALRAVALCEAGRSAEGRAAARLFLREHPRAALAHRVRSSCLE